MVIAGKDCWDMAVLDLDLGNVSRLSTFLLNERKNHRNLRWCNNGNEELGSNEKKISLLGKDGNELE